MGYTNHNAFPAGGILVQYTKLPKPTVVRIVKCIGHGCSIGATADIGEVDLLIVKRLLENASTYIRNTNASKTHWSGVNWAIARHTNR